MIDRQPTIQGSPIPTKPSTWFKTIRSWKQAVAECVSSGMSATEIRAELVRHLDESLPHEGDPTRHFLRRVMLRAVDETIYLTCHRLEGEV